MTIVVNSQPDQHSQHAADHGCHKVGSYGIFNRELLSSHQYNIGNEPKSLRAQTSMVYRLVRQPALLAQQSLLSTIMKKNENDRGDAQMLVISNSNMKLVFVC